MLAFGLYSMYLCGCYVMNFATCYFEIGVDILANDMFNEHAYNFSNEDGVDVR